MKKGKLITLTGGDLCGKATQAFILTEIIKLHNMHCEQMEFPRYNRPFCKIMGAMLDEQIFSISGYWVQDRQPNQHLSRPGIDTMRGGHSWMGKLSKKADSKTFQALCQADKMDAQQEIEDALERGHLICDRYDPELLVYGIVDSNPEWAQAAYDALDHKSDIVVVLMNRSGQYTRPGEIKDVNERDLSFQHKVYDIYEELAPKYGWGIIRVDEYQSDDPFTSIVQVAQQIVSVVSEKGLKLNFRPEDIHWIRRKLEARIAA